ANDALRQGTTGRTPAAILDPSRGPGVRSVRMPPIEATSSESSRSGTLGSATVMPAARAVLFTAALAHVLHDGFSDVQYVLLPLWATEFHLTLTGVGVLKAVYTAGMAISQIPAGLLAERWGERRLLVVGTAVTALWYLALSMGASGMLSLVGLLLVAGLGSGGQHPPPPSLLSRAYRNGPPPPAPRPPNL